MNVMGIFRRLFFSIVILIVGSTGQSWAQGKGVEGPAAEELNLIYAVGNQWALYGALQEARIDQAAFEAIVERVKNSKFNTLTTQVVVIIRDSDTEGTLGLIEKRSNRRTSGTMVSDESYTAFDAWHQVGCNVTPDKVIADHLENILAAEELYKDLPIVFTGSVKRVGKDQRGDVYVEFVTRYPEVGAFCYPWQEAPQKIDLKTLKASDKLKVSGQFTELSSEGLKLRGCLFSR